VPDPQLDPILICTIDPRSAQTMVTALRAYRRTYSGVADEANRADRWISALDRALYVYWSWIEERHRASENSEAAAVLRGREGATGRGQDASGEGDERRRGGQDGAQE
jgi:hypothetical protein